MAASIRPLRSVVVEKRGILFKLAISPMVWALRGDDLLMAGIKKET